MAPGDVVGHHGADGQVDLLAARLLDDALAAAFLLDRGVGDVPYQGAGLDCALTGLP
jgi:hypothetical protein